MVQALEGLMGIKSVEASHPEKKAVVVYDPDLITLEQMQKALLKAGYVASIRADEGNRTDFPLPHFEGKNEFQGKDLVCFCFGFRRHDIEQDFIENGQSTIMAKIASEKKTGGCDCAVKNPKGR